MADSQEAVTQASPFDESAGQSDAIFDESAKESGTVAHDADAATSDSAQQEGEPVKKAAKLTAQAESRGNQSVANMTKPEPTKSNKKKKKPKPPMSPKEKEAAKPKETETPKPVKKRPAGQALSDPPSTAKTQQRQRLHQ